MMIAHSLSTQKVSLAHTRVRTPSYPQSQKPDTLRPKQSHKEASEIASDASASPASAGGGVA